MRLLCLACLLLAACATPSPRFFGQAPLRLASGGHGFALYRRGAEAEILRTSRSAAPDRAAIARAARRATEAATGCEVAWARGDAALMRMGLACGSSPAPPKPAPPLALECEALDVYAMRPETGLSDMTLECWTP